MADAALPGVGRPESAGTDAAPSVPGRPDASAAPRWGGRVSFVAALVVLGVALAIGAGVGSSSSPTNAQRAAAIEAQVRCPSCDDLSVAQSSASSALAVRHQIVTQVDRGESATQIENELVGQYGPSILLSPPDSGLSALIWYVPAVAGGLAVCALAAFFWRRSRSWRALRGSR